MLDKLREELREIAVMHNEGLISDDEYRAKVLDSIVINTNSSDATDELLGAFGVPWSALPERP